MNDWKNMPRATWGKGFTSEFNSALAFLEELHRLNGKANEIAVYAKSGNPDATRPYYSIVWQMFTMIKPQIDEKTREMFQGKLDEIIDKFDENTPDSMRMLPSMIDSFHSDILITMQNMGFLLPKRREGKGNIFLKGSEEVAEEEKEEESEKEAPTPIEVVIDTIPEEVAETEQHKPV